VVRAFRPIDVSWSFLTRHCCVEIMRHSWLIAEVYEPAHSGGRRLGFPQDRPNPYRRANLNPVASPVLSSIAVNSSESLDNDVRRVI